MATIYTSYKIIQNNDRRSNEVAKVFSRTNEADNSANEVNNIYTPTPQMLSGLDSEKIRNLRSDPKIMGITFTFKKGTLVPIYIKIFSEQTLDASKKVVRLTNRFYAYDFSDDHLLGLATAKPMLESNNHFSEFWPFGGKDDYLIGNGLEVAEVNKIWLENVKNEDLNYKNVGVILIKAIHQRYRPECQGRMVIEAARNVHPYYYKLGFRAFDPEKRVLLNDKNSLYASHAKQKQIPKMDFGSVYMYLPDHACQLWKNEIDRNPIGWPEQKLAEPEPKPLGEECKSGEKNANPGLQQQLLLPLLKNLMDSRV